MSYIIDTDGPEVVAFLTDTPAELATVVPGDWGDTTTTDVPDVDVTLPLTIDADRALELLERAVALRGPEFTYRDEYGGDGCNYAVSGAPACMVGVALDLAGVDVRGLMGGLTRVTGYGEHDTGGTAAERYVATTELCGDDYDEEAYDSRDDELLKRGALLTEDAVRIWWMAQDRQDTGSTWGAALDSAREVARLLREQT